MRYTSVETLRGARDWAVFYRELVKHERQVAIGTPLRVLTSIFEQLLQEYHNDRCLLGYVTLVLVRRQGTFLTEARLQRRGLTPAVFHQEVLHLGGYHRHWPGLYHREFAQTLPEWTFLTRWMMIWEDARDAPESGAPRIGDEAYGSWAQLSGHAERQILRGVQVIQRRFKEEGPQELWRGSPPVAAEMPGGVAFVRRMLGVSSYASAG